MNYNESARLGLERYQKDRAALLLAIESSCDETAASVLRGAREVVSMSVYTQIPLHRRFGGVVPELASRSHVEKVGSVVADALEKAGVTPAQTAMLGDKLLTDVLGANRSGVLAVMVEPAGGPKGLWNHVLHGLQRPFKALCRSRKEGET